MRTSTTLLGLGLLLATFGVQASVCSADDSYENHYHGRTNCSSGTLDDATINGPAHLTDMTIDGTVRVDGTFSGDNITLSSGALNINGPTTMDHFSMSGGSLRIRGTTNLTNATLTEASFYGLVHINNSTLKQDVSFYSNSVTLNQVTTHALTINEDRHHHSDSDQKPHVYLHNATINGDITFQGRAGIVSMDSTSHLTGKIINGTTTDSTPHS